ncbi:VTT domain-containing protein [Floricoccus penangensis]|nr:VTT domain-containing protein [Floricoccus penangensis]
MLKSEQTRQRIVNIVTVVAFLSSFALAFYLYKLGIFNDDNVLKSTVEAHPVFGPLLMIGLQIIQVVVPVVPAGILCASAVLIFGPIWGFIYNYIGIVLGSLILFHMGRQYGKPFVMTFVPEKTYNKYLSKVDKGKKFDWFFFWMIFAPVAPDDALVLIASQTRMTYKFFTFSIVIGKIFGVGLYSLAWTFGLEWLKNFL